MKKQNQKYAVPFVTIAFFVLSLGFSLAISTPPSFSDEEDVDGVAGCNATAVDPSMSLEEQQSICGAAEQFGASSCGRSGHGVCSSPKTNDSLVDGHHCVCLSEMTEAAP